MNSPGVSATVSLAAASSIEMLPKKIASTPLRVKADIARAVAQFDKYSSASLTEEKPEGNEKTSDKDKGMKQKLETRNSSQIDAPSAQSEAFEANAASKDVDLVEDLGLEQAVRAIARANLEQARRTANCMQDCMASLLQHLDQPCTVIDRNGGVIQWNEALAACSGIDQQEALGKTLTDVFALSEQHPLSQALLQRNAAETYTPDTWTVRVITQPIAFLTGIQTTQLTLIPQYHVPGSLKAIIVLIQISR